MEYTLADIQKNIDECALAHPELGVAVKRIRESDSLKEIMTYAKIDLQYLPDIEFELLLVVTLYVPLSELAENITQSTGIQIETSRKLVHLIEAILLDDIIDGLRQYDIEMRVEGSEEAIAGSGIETKERLELRPQTTPSETTPVAGVAPNPAGAKPLTREELMNALGGRRTMASDIEAVRQKREGGG